MIWDCLKTLLAIVALAAPLLAGQAPAQVQGSIYQDGITFGVGRLSVFQVVSYQDCITRVSRTRVAGPGRFSARNSTSPGATSVFLTAPSTSAARTSAAFRA
jgi:hypothetical protein